jgi:cell division inhibitor SepF
MSMFRRAMDYLGLGPDDAYEDYDASTQVDRERVERDRTPRGPGHDRGVRDAGRDHRGRHERHERVDDLDGRDGLGERQDSGVTLRGRGVRDLEPSVRPIPVRADPVTVYPARYEDAKELADHFATGRPVIINVQSTEARVMRRIVDFASGVCYAQGGQMEKIEQGVFVMRPGARTQRT